MSSMFSKTSSVRVDICASVLSSIFDECDRYNNAETGGKLIGTFVQKKAKFHLTVSGVIEPGLAVQRTATSLFQDGDYQASVFRHVEKLNPQIEHLGSWHSHHVNGFPHLSGGDIDTYRRTVSHKFHNHNLFYALLVTEHTGGKKRYAVKHYILFRNDPAVYEIPEKFIEITKAPATWIPHSKGILAGSHDSGMPDRAEYSRQPVTLSSGSEGLLTRKGVDHIPLNPSSIAFGRAEDSKILEILYPGLSAYLSRATSSLYWKGKIRLIDNSDAQVRIIESESADGRMYVASVMDEQEQRGIGVLQTRGHSTPWMAAYDLERLLSADLLRKATTNIPITIKG